MAQNSLKRTNTTDRGVSPPATKRKVAGTATNKAVANFFKPASAKEPEKIIFKTFHDSLLVARYDDATNITSRQRPVKIAAFDFDDTLITTKSGLTFARDHNDWRWWDPTVPGRLKQLDADGYTIVVVTNQGTVKLAPDPKSKAPKAEMKSVQTFKSKVEAVLNQLELPVSLYAATRKDLFRKPRTRTWDQILDDYGLKHEGGVDVSSCIFVGDAGGRDRDKASGSKKDHSSCDRDFAHNVGIQFKTPEEFFLGEDERPFARVFEPGAHLETKLATAMSNATTALQRENIIELVLFCGSPGSGKSTFYWTQMKPQGYERVNQDILKTRDKCMKVATHYIQDEKTSVVVDNTNADVETRSAWIALAKKLRVPIRLVHFTASAKLCEHNDIVRALGGDIMNPERRTMLPKMAFTGFASRYREPKVEEGFQDITRVDFQFEGTEEQRRLWSRYWIS
ncbi:PNK3P-domain-containing protein [Polychaeton citri CBS 116435]|uniref:PNK3P-domain-containing protein n=1 Tax=Polychaeton citri CBS 116435 TaxID=1314669 RepID=A0A9P4UQ46_9PEZI|nr:PNK3P-domain-containing protein [Polychaeton citri CBS 116435]